MICFLPKEERAGEADALTDGCWVPFDAPGSLRRGLAASGRGPETAASPAAGLEHLGLIHGGDSKAFHGAGAFFAALREDLRIVEVGGGADDGAGANLGFFRIGEGVAVVHEDAGADEDRLGAELADEGRIGGSGDAAGGEVGDGELAALCD